VVSRSNLTPFRNEVIGMACSLHVSGGKRNRLASAPTPSR
jgi:hypothetical protein